MENLKKRWGINSNIQLTIIFFVFAITGSTAAKISNWMMELLGIYEKDIHWFLYYLLLIVLISGCSLKQEVTDVNSYSIDFNSKNFVF